MNAAFDQFIKEYNATGRKKIDGYSLPNLDRLNPAERLQAIEILKEEVIKNTWGIDGLASCMRSSDLNKCRDIRYSRSGHSIVGSDDSYAMRFLSNRI